ncbi:UNVERIFIED_CONTAM: hypothetical protein K2H54_048153 [Gekko kuhli]
MNLEKERYILNDRGPTFFLACFSVAAGLAFIMYYYNPESELGVIQHIGQLTATCVKTQTVQSVQSETIDFN